MRHRAFAGDILEKDKQADGLRGLAALNVFLSHFLLAFFPLGFVHFFPWVAQAHAQSGWAERVLSTPILSILWNGQFPVRVFFVLSGYVLTKGFVERGDIEGIRSKAARRYFRLGIPVFFSVMLGYVLLSLNAYQAAETVKLTGSAWLEGQTHAVPNIGSALRDGIYGALFLGHQTYNGALWTMRVEFIGSMLIFAYRLLAWRGYAGIFAAVTYIALTFFVAPDYWTLYVAFLLGTYIGEWPRPSSRIIAWGAATAGAVIASVDGSPVFAWLNATPIEEGLRGQLYSMFGAALLVYGVRGGAFSGILLSWPAQFLGRISYSLYLIHLPLIFSVGCGIFNWLHANQQISRSLAAGGSLIVTLVAVVILAWVFQRLVDEPAIRFAKAIVPGRRKSASSAPVLSISTA